MEQIFPILAERILKNAPRERDPRYFRIWQRVSLALQRAMREWIVERYFEGGPARFEDRETAYNVLVYGACRLCYGRPKTEFTFDVADPQTVASAMHNIGVALRLVLQPVEKRLRQADRRELARRYSAVWRQDILRDVKKRPRVLIDLIAAEAKLIEAVIDLGTSGDLRRFHRGATGALRNLLGEDLRVFSVCALQETARVLTEQKAGGFDYLLDAWIAERHHALGAGSPNGRIGGEEDRHDGNADGGGEVSDAGIVADVQARRGEPAGELIKVIVSDSVLEKIFGSGDPFDRAGERGGGGTEIFERPVLARAS